MTHHPARRLSAAVLTMLIWGVLIAGAVQAKVGPDDPNAPYITQPDPSIVVVTEPASWTRYALVAAIACLVGVAATLAVQFVLRHGRRTSMAHA